MQAIAPFARAAFANGLAASGGPITDRVKAGCIAAIEHACLHADEPDILEVTLKIGSLEGTWAAIFSRREKLISSRASAALAAWKSATARLDLSGMITTYRRDMRLSETDTPSQEQAAQRAAREAAILLLSWLPATAAWQDLRTAMRETIMSGRAEGYADAIALAADAVGRIGYGFDLAFQDAYDALANLGEIWADADTWLTKVLARNADQLGRALGTLASRGASYDEMLQAARDILDGVSGDAVKFVTDWALSTGLSQGALDLYRSEGVTYVDWITAGDARVCFPKGTPISTPAGDRPIERLEVGCLVVTPFGPRAVSAVFVRDHVDPMVEITTTGMSVVATREHPFWTSRGWKAAGELGVGDFLESLDDEFVEIESILDLDVGNANRPPSELRELRVPPCIPVGDPGMPVGSIDFECYAEFCEREIYGPAVHGELLIEGNTESLKRFADPRFQAVFPAKATSAVVPAELLLRCLNRDSTYDASAHAAVHQRGRASAFLGAETSIQTLLGSETLAAPLAVDVLGVAGLAGGGTVGVAGSDGSLDRELPFARRADLCDPARAAVVVASTRTEGSFGIARDSGIEDDGASYANAGCVDHRCMVVAPPGAENPGQLGPTRPAHRYAATRAGIGERHPDCSPSQVVTGGDSIQVYDIEVEGAHVFYAGGFLVHNCVDPCERNEYGSPYLISDFPDMPGHPLCRCVTSASFVLPSSFDGYFPGG